MKLRSWIIVPGIFDEPGAWVEVDDTRPPCDVSTRACKLAKASYAMRMGAHPYDHKVHCCGPFRKTEDGPWIVGFFTKYRDPFVAWALVDPVTDVCAIELLPQHVSNPHHGDP